MGGIVPPIHRAEAVYFALKSLGDPRRKPLNLHGSITTGTWFDPFPLPLQRGSSIGAGGGMRVLIADDHEIVRTSVRAILESRENIEVCGEAVNGSEAVLMATVLLPDLIILDYSMPVLDGLAAASQLRDILPKVPILILSMHDGYLLSDALQFVGAQGFIPKCECASRLLEGVEAVLRGETFFIEKSVSRRGQLH